MGETTAKTAGQQSTDAHVKNSTSTELRHAWCTMCGPARIYCSTLCTVEDGRWTHVEGNPDAGNNGIRGGRTLCAKGNAALQVPYSEERIEYPMRRVGQKGEGRFERISWEEALDEIASTLKEQKRRFGAESYGVLSPQHYDPLATLGRRFLNVHGSPNYLHSGICHAQRTFSKLVTLGGTYRQPTDTAPGQMDKTQLLVSWGYNPENSAVNLGEPRRRLDAMARGMKVVDIRPLLDPLASKADIWMPIRPGTDCALALAILHVIIGENLYDRNFVEQWCSGFAELAAHVQQFTPAWAADITGLPEQQIVQVARLMGTCKPMGIRMGNGIGDQASDGHWTVACICLIEAITGNLGVAGGGGAALKTPSPLVRLKPIDVLSDRLPASPEDIENGWMAGVSKLVAPETPRWFQNMSTQETGPTSAYFKAFESVLTGKPYPLRFVFAQATNPLSATRQPKVVVEALKKLDHYVVMDTVWNSSCDFADIVLPACTQYEVSDRIGIKNSSEGTFIAIGQKVCEPFGESRSDWQYYLDLAVRMGYGSDFWNGSLDAMLAEQLEGTGITLEQLRAADHGIFLPRTDGAKPTEPVYRDYVHMFERLPGGKVQCTNAYIGGKPDNTDTGTLDASPIYRGAPESLAGSPELAHDYPLVFSDVHAFRLCQHSYYHDVPYLRELQPEPWVLINPATAREHGIAEGDWVRVESPHGWVKLCARLFEGVAPDVLMSKRGWWEPCRQLGLPGHGFLDGGSEVNVLYSSRIADFDPLHSAMPKQTLVRISRLDTAADKTAALVTSAREPRDSASATGLCEADGPASVVDSRAFHFDSGRCIGCFACEVACKQWHGFPAATIARRRVVLSTAGTFPDVRRVFESIACRHCVDPACVAACPAGAICKREEDGMVVVDADACVGCGSCADACPYGIPQMVEQKDGSVRMDKCDGCVSLGRAPGEAPHCVATCPTGALTFG